MTGGSGVGWCGDRTGSSEVARCEAQARGNVVTIVVVLVGVVALFVIGVVRMLRNPRQR